MVQPTNSDQPETLTENGAASLATTGSARIDLFFKLTRDVVKNDLYIPWLTAAWSGDPLDTMKLLFNSRDCRGGKGDRAPFIRGMGWVSQNQPAWFQANLDIVPTYGRWLDVVELLPHVEPKHATLLINLLAEQLQADVASMSQGEPVTLAAKWVPTEKKKWDVKCNTTERLCLALYGDASSQYRKKFRTEVISPLRQYIDIVERRMCTGDWENINFSKVPSVAMTKLRKAFAKNAPETFEAWLEQVKAGEKKINASQVYPHTLVTHYYGKYVAIDGVDDVIEEQWKEIVKATSELGTFNRSLVISDVSASMSGTPMEVSVALGILIASLTAPPFDGLVITFSEYPKFHTLRNLKTLQEKVESVRNMNWGGTTDLQKVFTMVLQRAVEYSIPSDSMPTRLYILSDMQFNQCDRGQTNYAAIREKYATHGYAMPEIVFWNLRSDNTRDLPVAGDESGAALISGFSPAILKAVMAGQEITPWTVMRNAIDDARYDLVKRPTEEVVAEGEEMMLDGTGA